MYRAAFNCLVSALVLLLQASGASADFLIKDRIGRTVGVLPDMGGSAFLRQMERGLWVRFPFSSPATINSIRNGTVDGGHTLLFETGDCTGAPFLQELTETEWISRGLIIGSNQAGTEGLVYYGKGGIVSKPMQSAQYWENGTPTCNVWDGAYPRRVYALTVVINASQLGLLPPFRMTFQ